VRPALREEQLAKTLERHGLPADTPVLGIRYIPRVVVVIEGGRRLRVPPDVLDMPAPPRPNRRGLGWPGID
jgi:hypothetical protein